MKAKINIFSRQRKAEKFYHLHTYKKIKLVLKAKKR